MTVAFMVNAGQWALVDDEDASRVLATEWKAYTNKAGGNTYVRAVGWGRASQTYLHRFILGAPKGALVDHVNGNGLDNRRSNLRLTDHRGNAANVRKMAGGTSRFKGVYWNTRLRKWHAQLKRVNGRTYIGLFTDEFAAARAYDAAARDEWGAFARLNFPDENELAA